MDGECDFGKAIGSSSAASRMQADMLDLIVSEPALGAFNLRHHSRLGTIQEY